MTKRSSGLRAFCLALGLASLVTTSCASSRHEQWSFYLSRQCYGEGGAWSEMGNAFSSSAGDCRDSGAAVALVAILLLPVIVDVVVLPVTGVHDVCAHR